MRRAEKDREVSTKDTKIASLQEQIALMKAELKDPHNLLRRLHSQIGFLETRLENSIPYNNTVDLTGDGSDDGQANINQKRPRIEEIARNDYAKEHLQNLNSRLVQVKEEKAASETALVTVRVEKETVKANLEEPKNDLDDAEELNGQQALAVNILQGRIDELVSLARAAGADGAVIAEIQNRTLASGR